MSVLQQAPTGDRLAAVTRDLARPRGGKPPYGYRARGGQLIPHPGEQAIIAAALDMRADGLTLRAIGARLDRLGYTTRQGRPWQPSAVASLLHQAALDDTHTAPTRPPAGTVTSPTNGAQLHGRQKGGNNHH